MTPTGEREEDVGIKGGRGFGQQVSSCSSREPRFKDSAAQSALGPLKITPMSASRLSQAQLFTIPSAGNTA